MDADMHGRPDGTTVDLIRWDYGRFLAEYGFTRELVKRVADFNGDKVAMPAEFDGVELRPSPIAGRGMFTTRPVVAGELLGPARLNGMRTPAGYGTNHSPHPNAYFAAVPGGDLHMLAGVDIDVDEEVTVDYRQAGRVNGAGFMPDPAEVAETLRRRCTAPLDHPDAGSVPKPGLESAPLPCRS